ncbi:hypothetical protein F5B21DRAFT_171399 [Xylaria acuta]|nr:hypothetical protein F5B21DRAFT_171399 [Xylaria acuta]
MPRPSSTQLMAGASLALACLYVMHLVLFVAETDSCDVRCGVAASQGQPERVAAIAGEPRLVRLVRIVRIVRTSAPSASLAPGASLDYLSSLQWAVYLLFRPDRPGTDSSYCAYKRSPPLQHNISEDVHYVFVDTPMNRPSTPRLHSIRIVDSVAHGEPIELSPID